MSHSPLSSWHHCFLWNPNKLARASDPLVVCLGVLPVPVDFRWLAHWFISCAVVPLKQGLKWTPFLYLLSSKHLPQVCCVPQSSRRFGQNGATESQGGNTFQVGGLGSSSPLLHYFTKQINSLPLCLHPSLPLSWGHRPMKGVFLKEQECLTWSLHELFFSPTLMHLAGPWRRLLEVTRGGCIGFLWLP